MSQSSPLPALTAFFAIDKEGSIVYKSPGLAEVLRETGPIETLEDLRRQIDPAQLPDFDRLLRRPTTQAFRITADSVELRLRLNTLQTSHEKTFYFLEIVTRTSALKGPLIDRITENAYGIITFVDKQGVRLYVSPGVEKTFAVSKDTLVGRNIFLDVHPGDLPKTRGFFRQILEHPGIPVRGVRIRFRHPKEGWLLMEGSLINLTDTPAVEAVVINSRSIQPLQNLQDSIREYQFKLEGMIEHAEALVYMKDLEGHYVVGNTALAEALGGDKSLFLGKRDADIFSRETASRLRANDALVLETRAAQKFSEEINFARAPARRFLTNKFPLFDAQQQLVGLCAIAYDVTREQEYLQEVEKSAAFFQAIVENSFDYVVVLDGEGHKLLVTPSVRSVIGFSEEEYLRLPFFENIHPEDEPRLQALWSELLTRSSPHTLRVDLRVRDKKNRWTWVEYAFDNSLNNKHIQGIVVHVITIHETKLAQLQALENKLLFEDFMRNNPNAKAIFDSEGKLLTANDKFRRQFGQDKDLMAKITASNPGVVQADGYETFDLVRSTGTKSKTYEVTKFALRNHAGNVYGVGVVAIDVTARVESQARVARLAYYDELTGLANKYSLHQMLHGKIERQEPFALVSIDLYKFRIANDSLGPKNGDKLIVKLGQIIQKNLGPKDFVARVSGDEFAIITGGAEREEVEDLTGRIMSAAKESFVLSGIRLTLQPTAGVVFSGPNYAEPTNYIRDTNIAVQQAKKQGSYAVAYFDREMGAQVRARLTMQNDILQAFENEEFELFYQPIHPYPQEESIYFEALIRWNHPVHGRLSPGSFFKYIEEPALRSRLDAWVLEEAIAQTKALLAHHSFGGVSINLNSMHFGSQKFVQLLQKLLRRYELPTSCLRLEVTENSLLRRQKTAIKVMKKLRAMGIKILLDDFGTGYSSLSYLSQLPIDLIKIDRSFVSTMQTNERNYQLVAMIVEIAKTLDLGIVAEGVETEAQLTLLREFEYAAIQGFYYSRPLPFAKVATYLTQ